MQQDVGQQTQKNPIACVIICLKWHINRTKSSDKKANNYCCPWHYRTAKKQRKKKTHENPYVENFFSEL